MKLNETWGHGIFLMFPDIFLETSGNTPCPHVSFILFQCGIIWLKLLIILLSWSVVATHIMRWANFKVFPLLYVKDKSACMKHEAQSLAQSYSDKWISLMYFEAIFEVCLMTFPFVELISLHCKNISVFSSFFCLFLSAINFSQKNYHKFSFSTVISFHTCNGLYKLR